MNGMNNNLKLTTVIVAFLLGIAVCLALRPLKYTEFISPVIDDVSPKVVYNKLLNTPNDMVIIDVRSEYEYNQAHAKGSINLPIHYFYDDTHGLPNEKGVALPKNTNKEIYLICTGGRLAGVAYSYLEHYGYRNIKRVEGGISNWNANGLPVITKSIFGVLASTTNAGLDRPYVNK